MKRTLFPPVLALLLTLAACSAPSPEASAAGGESAYHSITAQEAKELMDGEEDVIVVDVRTQEEYDAAHLPGAILIPNETISDVQPDALTDLDAKLIVYCRTGVRSKQASDKLVEIGFTDVNDMGGIQDWPYDTVTD